MCPPATRRQKKNTHKHFFFEVDSNQESFIKNIHMNMHTPEQQLIHEEHEHAPPPRRAIRHQLSSELLIRYQLFAERRHHQETQEELARTQQHVELFREIRQIERQLRSSDTPVNIREQLRRRHEELCALLDILDTN